MTTAPKNTVDRSRDPYRQDRPSRFAIALRRIRRIAPQACFVMVLLGAIGGCGFLFLQQLSYGQSDTIRSWLQKHTLLPINRIDVVGAHLTTDTEIEHALGAARGKPIFSFSISDAQKRLSKLLFVSKVTVQRRMPDTVRIIIEERDPMAIWQIHGKFLLINRDGRALADAFEFKDHIKAFLSLPFVVGEGADQAAAQLIDTIALFPTVKPFIAAAIRVGNRRWSLLLRDDTRVELPEGHEHAALQRLAQYQQRYRLLERAVAVIDMRLPDRMVIRLQPTVKASSNEAMPETKIPIFRPDDAPHSPKSLQAPVKPGDAQTSPFNLLPK